MKLGTGLEARVASRTGEGKRDPEAETRFLQSFLLLSRNEINTRETRRSRAAGARARARCRLARCAASTLIAMELPQSLTTSLTTALSRCTGIVRDAGQARPTRRMETVSGEPAAAAPLPLICKGRAGNILMHRARARARPHRAILRPSTETQFYFVANKVSEDPRHFIPGAHSIKVVQRAVEKER